jgi:hypothetical protein
MPPDRDHFNGSVNLDGAGSVMREVVTPIPAGRPAGQARGMT